MVKLVSINSKEDVQRINRIACEQPFDMSLSSGSMIVDAKSLLALFNFVGKKTYIIAPDDINPNYFNKIIKRMKVA